MSDFGSDDDGSFNRVSKAYKANPTIDHYVKLRRKDPKAEIEIAVTGGLDQLYFMEEELNSYGFAPRLYASILDADPDAISELSLQIMEKMIEARVLEKAGETHLLIVLIRERLGGSHFEIEQANATHQRRWNALIVGGMLRARGEQVSMRKLAAALGVSPSTITRWFPNGDFHDEIKTIASWFDEDGKIRMDTPSKKSRNFD